MIQIKLQNRNRLRKGTHGGRRGRDSYGIWQGHSHTAIFKMDNQQKPIV